MLFSVAMRRDEEMASFLMRIVLNFLINATFGMIGVVLAFMSVNDGGVSSVWDRSLTRRLCVVYPTHVR